MLPILALLAVPASGWLLDCLTLGSESFLFVPETVTPNSGPVALRFYHGDTVSVVPLQHGEVIMDLPGFDPKKKVVFYFLGFHQNANSESAVTMTAALQSRGDSNVVLVDWSGFSTKDFFTAVLGCYFHVPQLADVIRKMVSRGVPVRNFHLIGHSLGANCAGYTARRFHTATSAKLPLITGLDPAGPLVGVICGTSLKKGDAEFVQIIHSDRGFYGTARACGDLDVFLNRNGRRFQPGCPCALLPFSFTKKEACSHILAWKSYAESLTRPSALQCAMCSGYLKFRLGFCANSQRALMGFGAKESSRGKCYLRTNKKAPYGRGPSGAEPGRPLLEWIGHKFR